VPFDFFVRHVAADIKLLRRNHIYGKEGEEFAFWNLIFAAKNSSSCPPITRYNGLIIQHNGIKNTSEYAVGDEKPTIHQSSKIFFAIYVISKQQAIFCLGRLGFVLAHVDFVLSDCFPLITMKDV
jgi:hypothetical protein